MLLMGLIWLRVPEKPEFILCVMWETSVLVVQMLALQEGSAVGWMIMESLISLWQGRISPVFKVSTQPPR
jgi:hypothetical protein